MEEMQMDRRGQSDVQEMDREDKTTHTDTDIEIKAPRLLQIHV